MTAQIEWRDEFSIGIPAVDHEHREMIDLINSLILDIEVERPPEHIAGVLGEVYSGIAAHFALEEFTMRSNRYTGYAAHKESHEQLLDEIRDIMDEQEGRSGEDIGEELARRLHDWFVGHFKTFDAPLHKAIGDGH